MIDVDWTALASAIAGSTVSGALARSFIAQKMHDLDNAVAKISEIKTELAKITVRLEALDRSHDLVQEIDRKVVALETKLHGVNAKHKGGHASHVG